MKHCLKQREKLDKKFTFAAIGLDGPWENDEVTIRFNKVYSRISMWGTDDFGMELINASEQDYHTIVNLCAKKTPTINILKKMGYVYC